MNTNLLKKNGGNFKIKLKKEMLAFFILFGFLVFNNANAQTTAYNYNYSESAGQTYTPITGGTVVASGVFTAIAAWPTINIATLPTPFVFHFNGAAIQTVSVSDNGFVILGGAAPVLPATATAAPISTATGYTGAVACYGYNLVGTIASAEVRYEVIGSAPNRVFVAQYKDLQRKPAIGVAYDGLMNMQIRLNEANNVIEVIYKDFPSSTTSTIVLGQDGLRGATNADFNGRRNLNFPYFTSAAGTVTMTTNAQGLNTQGTNVTGVIQQGPLPGTRFVWTPCFAPAHTSAPSFSGITATLQGDNSTLNINWINPSFLPSGGFDFEVRLDALAPGSAGAFATGNTSSYTAPVAGAPYTLSVPGLATGITYYIYVKPNCKSTWMPYALSSNVPTTIPTASFPVALIITPTCPNATIPYTQNFEGAVTPAIPNCNSVVTVSGPLMVTQNNTSLPYYGFNSKNIITVGALSQNTWFFTQPINVTAADIAASGGSFKLSYKYGGSREQAFFEQKMKIYYGTVASVAGMTTLLADHSSIKASPINGVINFTIAAPGAYYIGFNGYANASQGFLQIDDINLDYSSCKPPTALTSGQVTTSSAIISWTAPVSVPSGGYQYIVSTVNTPPISTSLPTGNTLAGVTLTTLTSLTPSTTYYFWVRSNCGGGDSSVWSIVGSFTTLPPYILSCTPSGATFGQDPNGITNVTMGSINNTTGIEINNYGDYSGLITNVAQGATIPVSITYGTGFTYDTAIWVDWNNDGVFADPGERVYTGMSAAPNPSTLAASFVVPATQPFGPYRLRIGGIDGPLFTGGPLAPCRNGQFQAYEDYSIYVIAPPPALTLSGSSNIICAGDVTIPVTLTSNVADFQVYSWTPLGVLGDQYSGWTFNPTTTTTYILTATQTSGSFASNTASYTITVNPLPTPITITSSVPATCQNAAPGGVGSTLVASGGIVSGVEIMSENFNGATNTFTTVNNSSPALVSPTNNPADAAWMLHNSPYLYGGFTTFSSNDASQFYLSNSDDQGSSGLTNTELISPSFSLAAPITNASLSFYHHYRGFPNGTARVDISLDNGVTWNPIPGLIWTTATQGGLTNFVNVTANLAPYLGATTVKIKFNYINAQFAWFWAIDNVKVTGSSTSDITWSPLAGLYTNPGLTIPYIGTATSTVYAAPTVNTIYYAGADSLDGCHTETPVTVTIIPVAGGTASSNQVVSACGGVPLPLNVAGNTGTVTSWQYANNPAFTGPINIAGSNSATLASGLMTPLITSGVKYFRAVSTTGSCQVAYSTIVSVTVDSTTWGLPGPAWQNGLPSSTKDVTFASNYSSIGNINACSVFVTNGANVTFNANNSLIVENTVNVAVGTTLTFNDDASLVQTKNVVNAPLTYNGGNVGAITYRRDAMPMIQYDYTYWSAPVYTNTLFNLSPLTLSDKYFEFNTTSNVFQPVASLTVMTPGKGYIIRAPQGYNATPTIFTGIFNGVPNNGTITIPMVFSSANFNLIGNPYPSSLSADLFLSDALNTGFVDGTMYFWTHNSPIAANNYSPADYALYNYSGGIGTGTPALGTNNSTPTGFVGSGQSFFVKSLANGNATFKNSMRAINNNNQFYRNGQLDEVENPIAVLEKNRVWLEVFSSSSQNLYKQTMVGYIENATNGLDRGFDGEIVDAGNAINLYSTIGTTKLGIQGRALPFDVNDSVPLGFKSTVGGTFEIRLSNFDGLFTNQAVYLEDKLINVIHDLKQSNYSFATNVGTFEDRFQLRFTSTALQIDEAIFNENSVVIYKEEQAIHINTSNVVMDNVQIYDVRGRELYSKKGVNANEFVISNLNASQQVILVKVTSVDGKTITKKIVF
jgi:GEVED domain/Fibronectin type III domain